MMLLECAYVLHSYCILAFCAAMRGARMDPAQPRPRFALSRVFVLSVLCCFSIHRWR